MKEHLNHVRAVLQTLSKEHLYANMKKCTFGVGKVAYLGIDDYSKGVHVHESKQLKLGHNPPICNKCVAFLVLRDIMVAL